MLLSVIKDMFFSEEKAKFIAQFDTSKIKPMVSTERSSRNFCAIKMDQTSMYYARRTVPDLADKFYNFQRELLKKDIYVSLYVSQDLPQCTFIIIHKSNLNLVRDLYQKYYQTIDLMTDVQLFEFMNRWNRRGTLNYMQVARSSVILGCSKVDASYNIRVQDAKRAHEGEKFNVLISNNDVDYLRMIDEFHLNYTITELTESISEVVFNESL